MSRSSKFYDERDILGAKGQPGRNRTCRKSPHRNGEGWLPHDPHNAFSRHHM